MRGTPRSSAPPCRVFLVDDHPLVRDGLTMLISNDPGLIVCGTSDGIVNTLKQIAADPPDLLIVDLSLKDGNGLDLIKTVHERFPAVRSLVLSHYDERLYAERALRNGASGYVNKQQCDEVLIQAIRTVLSGQRYVSEDTLQRLVNQALGGKETESGEIADRLTDRELEVFRLIGQGISSADIAKRLHISPHTIDSHREHIRDKLGLKNGRELMQHAVRWVLEQEQS